MKVTVAPDSLKESLSAASAARAIARGVRRAVPGADVVRVPMADGGEGTRDAMVAATGGRCREVRVEGPLGEPVEASWGLCGDGTTAVVEMAAASGLELLPPERRDPMQTTTYGTGQLIRAALDAGARRIVVGIGGSATVDGGTGMAAALGVRFCDAAGAAIERPCGGRLVEIAHVDTTGLDPRLAECEITIACDVTNPLLGPEGAARVYAPQKGADPAQVAALERGLAHLARVVGADLDRHVADLPGAGAAGGLGAGLVAFLDARLESGVESVVRVVGLRERMAGSDLVLTAEGRIDGQSAFGKATAGVVEVAAELGVPVVALAGSLGPGYARMYRLGLAAAFPIVDRPMPLADALQSGAELLERTAESVVRLWCAAREVAHA